jgi:hypothetical protein
MRLVTPERRLPLPIIPEAARLSPVIPEAACGYPGSQDIEPRIMRTRYVDRLASS